jgi:hypothetical protein
MTLSDRSSLNKCWICETRGADSAEHNKKHSDIIREYGRGPYKGEQAPVLYRDRKFTDIQGPKSGLLRFGKSICEQCNNTGTQPFDLAYEKFADWVVENEAVTIRRRFIDFVDVYGEDFPVGQLNLFKYFAKVFGCALCDEGHLVPADVVDLLRTEHFTTALSISMSVNEAVFSWPKDVQAGFLGDGNVGIDDSDPNFRLFYWKRHLRWLTVFISYGDANGEQSSGRLGSIWIANKRVVYLGSDESPPFTFPDESTDICRRLFTR